jgi:GrpB-like predicted nucleotidyltransferase (UPF0157 family)
MEQPAIKILAYEARPARCDPPEAGVITAAAALVQYLRNELDGATVEHVGSTAVAGCDGKGIVDVMVVSPTGRLAQIRDHVDRLGFQRQMTRDPFPEDRPMRTGAFDYDGQRYLVHVHIVPAESTEVEDLRYFRDCLRADLELRRAYVKFKKKLLAEGISDSVDYAVAKGEFIRQCLGHQPPE